MRRDARILGENKLRGFYLPEQKQDDSFRVIDRRPFTAEGELRKDVAEEKERESGNTPEPGSALRSTSGKSAPAAAETPKRLPAFENLIRMLGSNAAMVLGAYTDPRTGPVFDPEAAREFIDMLDALQEKTKGHLAPEEESLLLDLVGKLKVTYVEVNRAVATQAAKAANAKVRS